MAVVARSRGRPLAAPIIALAMTRFPAIAAVALGLVAPRSAGYVRFTAVKEEDELGEALRRIDRFVRGLSSSA